MRKQAPLKKGDRIRLKVRTMGGWKGIGVVTQDQSASDDAVWFRKTDTGERHCSACRHEVAKIRGKR